jgi:hypothetical protein
MNSVTDLKFALNNLKLEKLDLQNYRFGSSIFNADLLENNIFEAETGSTQLTSDGYWIMTKPLCIGEHTIYSRRKTRL